jgi:hypothetical protein
MGERDVNDVVYLYGFVPAAAPPPPPTLIGVGDQPVELVDLGGVQAVIGWLPRASYDADRVSAGLQDMAWVGEHGLAHERVVLWYVDQADILPARLLTLYSSTAALVAAIAPRTSIIAQQITQLAGRREWNLKVAFDRAELGRHGAEISAAVRQIDDEIAAAPPGRRYLMERRRGELLKRELVHAAQQLAQQLLAGLAATAEDVRVIPLAGADAAAGTVVLSAALLVARDAEPAWRQRADALVQQHRELGMIVTLSGPWAPYRFLEAAADA